MIIELGNIVRVRDIPGFLEVVGISDDQGTFSLLNSNLDEYEVDLDEIEDVYKSVLT